MTPAAHHDTPRPAADLALCRQCDWVMRLPALGPRELARCPRCGHHIVGHTAHRHSHALAWATAALIMLALVFIFDFLSFETRGVSHTMAFVDAVRTLFGYGFPLLALLFLLTTAVLPGLYLLALAYVTAGAALGRRLPFGIELARVLHPIEPWMMSDVFLIGALVSLIKIVTLASVHVGPSFIVFCLYSLLLLKTMHTVDWHRLWTATAGAARVPAGLVPGTTGRAQQVALCFACGAPFRASRNHVCQRCGKRHWVHHLSRLQLTWALLATATILYIPANIYPIMRTTGLLGGSQSQTIAGGVLHLVETGSWPIALVIFFASIVVPVSKIAALAWLCLCARYGWHRDSRAQFRLFRFTEKVGRWSMIDIFVVAVLAALVQAGALMSIQPGPAVLSFATVVIVTMIAADTFDTRLLWRDAPNATKAA